MNSYDFEFYINQVNSILNHIIYIDLSAHLLMIEKEGYTQTSREHKLHA